MATREIVQERVNKIVGKEVEIYNIPGTSAIWVTQGEYRVPVAFYTPDGGIEIYEDNMQELAEMVAQPHEDEDEPDLSHWH